MLRPMGLLGGARIGWGIDHGGLLAVQVAVALTASPDFLRCENVAEP